MIVLQAKNSISHILYIGALNLYSRFFWHSESHGVLFIKITWFFRGSFLTFSKNGWVKLNFMNSIPLMYLLLSRLCFLQFRLLLSRIAPYLQFVTMNCLICLLYIVSLFSNMVNNVKFRGYIIYNIVKIEWSLIGIYRNASRFGYRLFFACFRQLVNLG